MGDLNAHVGKSQKLSNGLIKKPKLNSVHIMNLELPIHSLTINCSTRNVRKYKTQATIIKYIINNRKVHLA